MHNAKYDYFKTSSLVFHRNKRGGTFFDMELHLELHKELHK